MQLVPKQARHIWQKNFQPNLKRPKRTTWCSTTARRSNVAAPTVSSSRPTFVTTNVSRSPFRQTTRSTEPGTAAAWSSSGRCRRRGRSAASVRESRWSNPINLFDEKINALGFQQTYSVNWRSVATILAYQEQLLGSQIIFWASGWLYTRDLLKELPRLGCEPGIFLVLVYFLLKATPPRCSALSVGDLIPGMYGTGDFGKSYLRYGRTESKTGYCSILLIWKAHPLVRTRKRTPF